MISGVTTSAPETAVTASRSSDALSFFSLFSLGKKVHGNNDADAKRISRQRRNDLWNNDKCARRNQQNAQSNVFHRFSDKAFHARGKEERSRNTCAAA